MKVSDLAREYSKKYIKFLIDKGISVSSRDAYSMFRYVIHRIYGFRCDDISALLIINYEDCKKELLSVKDSVEVNTNVSEKSIIEYSCIYTLVALQYCAGNIRVRNVGLD